MHFVSPILKNKATDVVTRLSRGPSLRRARETTAGLRGRELSVHEIVAPIAMLRKSAVLTRQARRCLGLEAVSGAASRRSSLNACLARTSKARAISKRMARFLVVPAAFASFAHSAAARRQSSDKIIKHVTAEADTL